MNRIFILITLVILSFGCNPSTPCSPFETSCSLLGYILPDLIRPKANTGTGTGTGAGANSSITFTGLSNLKILSATSVELKWTAATSTAAGTMEYNIYVASTTGAQVFTTPLQTVSNVTTATITGITANTNNYYVVRAKDSAGTVDTNTSERAALLNGLIRFIPLDSSSLTTGEKIGNTVVTAPNSPPFTGTDRLGNVNNAYTLDGTSQYFNFNQTLPTVLPTGANPKTFCARTKTTSVMSQVIVGYGAQSNFSISHLVGFTYLNYDQFGGFGIPANANNILLDGNWNFVCVTITRSTANIANFQVNSDYVGGFVETIALNSTNAIQGTIGRFSNSTTQWFNGNIAEVSIWNRALSAAELPAVFKN